MAQGGVFFFLLNFFSAEQFAPCDKDFYSTRAVLAGFKLAINIFFTEKIRW